MTVRMRVRMMKLLVLPLFDSSASVTPCACVPTPASRAQGPSLQQGPPSGPPTPRGLTQFATFEFNQSDQRALSVCKSSSPGRASLCTPPPLDTPPPAPPLAPPAHQPPVDQAPALDRGGRQGVARRHGGDRAAPLEADRATRPGARSHPVPPAVAEGARPQLGQGLLDRGGGPHCH